jgi:hypothetical protein
MKMSVRSSKSRVQWAVLALLALAACDSATVGDTLGMNRVAPDEFTVVSRPSLAVPPEFTLRPPRPGEPPRGASANEVARTVLTGKDTPLTPDKLEQPKGETAVTPVVTSDAPSGATSSFLKRMGVDGADSDIRDKLAADTIAPAAPKAGERSTLFDWFGDEGEPVIDAKKEAERLRTNKDAGKPANEGEVAVEKQKKPRILDSIF